MLNDIYKAIKEQLNYISESEDCQWFNVQYENQGWAFTQGFFVEFPNAMQFDDISKMKRRSDLKIRIHIYKKDIQTTDGVTDQAVVNHENIASQVLDQLDQYILMKGEEQLCTKLIFRGWQHYHRFNGWMVTFVEFDAKKLF